MAKFTSVNELLSRDVLPIYFMHTIYYCPQDLPGLVNLNKKSG
ncbi:hypothetical protein [Thiomicrorhabdus sp.]|nr:hypothetical protein [Thiomicrorhabdus sp.]